MSSPCRFGETVWLGDGASVGENVGASVAPAAGSHATSMPEATSRGSLPSSASM